MPRKSAAALSTIVALTDARLEPPSYLTAEQLEEWRSIINSLPADYFRPGDAPLLAAYCVAATLYKRAAKDMEQRGITFVDDRGREVVNPAHQILTSQASALAQMSMKLRLCPSSRYSERAAHSKASATTGKRPWDDSALLAA